MTFQDVMDGISRVGLPAAMLVAILWGAYRIAKPLGERLVAAHVALIESLCESVKEMAETLKNISQSLQLIHDEVKSGREELRREIRESGHGRSKPS